MSYDKSKELSPGESLRIELCVDLIYQARFYWVVNHMTRSITLNQLETNADFVNKVSKLQFNFSKGETKITLSCNILVDNFCLPKDVVLPPDLKEVQKAKINEEIQKKCDFNSRMIEQWRTILRMNFILILEHILNNYIEEGGKKIHLKLSQNETDAIYLIHLFKNHLIHSGGKRNIKREIERFKKFGVYIDRNNDPKLSDQNLFELSEIIIQSLQKHIPAKDFTRCPYKLT